MYPTTISDAIDVLTNPTWDPYTLDHKPAIQDNNNNSSDNKKQDTNKNDEKEDNESKEAVQFMQDNKEWVCLICGGPHKMEDCDKRDEIPKKEWLINDFRDHKKEFQEYRKRINNYQRELQHNHPTNSKGQRAWWATSDTAQPQVQI